METLYDTIYRPPTEHQSTLLELSVGCSWGKCSFCRLANGAIPLQAIPMDTIKRNLLEMVCQGHAPRRMFLTGENALAFKTRYLLDIFQLIQSHLPTVNEFALYGRADDIGSKTDQQLQDLRAGGLATVYVGLESGNEEILLKAGKGETPREIAEQLRRLDQASIGYGLSSIIGLGGVEMWEANARDTAAFYNSVAPASIRLMTLTPMPGTPLEKRARNGEFRLQDPLLSLREERLLIESLAPEASNYRLVANHVSNLVPFVGNMPMDRQKMLDALDNAIASHENPIREKCVEW